jgi:hypothetical protein
MKIVIQCAARKNPAAGSFRDAANRPVLFVAQPGGAPANASVSYARPDEQIGDGQTWRERLVAYNEDSSNPYGLLPAAGLYAHSAYAALARRFGFARMFILSAGWGLIPSSFLTPSYDITFTASAAPWKRRRQTDRYNDLNLIDDDGDPIVFIGGKDYLPLFCSLTAPLNARKVVFFNSSLTPGLPERFDAVRYPTRTRTNWHYECAQDLAAGRLDALQKASIE